MNGTLYVYVYVYEMEQSVESRKSNEFPLPFPIDYVLYDTWMGCKWLLLYIVIVRL